MKFATEAEAADVVIEYLRDLKYEVYCEVETNIGRIDIVAVSGSVVTAVEVKNRCNLEVLGQAANRSAYVHRSIAAFPFPKNERYCHWCFRSMHEQYWIGIWDIRSGHVMVDCVPKINRKPMLRYVKDNLRDELKDQRAGVNKGYWSPFRQTREALVEYVRKNQPCRLKDAIDNLQHHYSRKSTAYTSIGRWIREGVIDEVTMTKQGLVLSESKT